MIPNLRLLQLGWPSLTEKRLVTLYTKYEEWTDRNLAMGTITQEVAWDSYFGLLHECDERMFWSDRQRILGKIDTKKYNPFLSRNPVVLIVARIRAAGNRGSYN